MRSYFWKGRTADFLWDGRDEHGNSIPDGVYTYMVRSADRAGNQTVGLLDGIRVDTQITRIFVTVSEGGFSPNGDGRKDTIDFKTFVSLKEGIKGWSLSMVNAVTGVQEVFSGKEAVPETITWEGRKEGGRAVDGEYVGVLEVEYLKGNKPEAKTRPFKLDTRAPEVQVGLLPVPFSPDNDGVEDDLRISMEVEDASGITEWKIEVLDPQGHHFISYAGKGEPTKQIIWDGISDRGELVQAAQDYTLELSIGDEYGNSVLVQEAVPVDVLVTREGEKLKIIISSIVFAANTADYAGVVEEEALRNVKTLDRLAEILKKYDTYRIRIEGHAVMIYWDDARAGREEQVDVLIPLSKARAEAVKEALAKRGVEGSRITTEGLGGANPIVPHSDTKNRWKNRRVEFILIR